MEGGDLDVVIHHVDQHERQEADQEGDEDGEHHLGQAEVLLPLRGGHAVLLGGRLRRSAVLLHVQSGKYFGVKESDCCLMVSLTCSVSPGRRWLSSRG